MAAHIKDQNIDPMTRFATMFGLYEANLNGHKDYPISGFRRRGYNEFSKLEFPTRRDEDWKYTPLAKILNEKYQDAPKVQFKREDLEEFRFDDLDVLLMVFINGEFQADLSDLDQSIEGLTITPVAEALKDDAMKGWIDQQVALRGGTEKNAFLQLNQAFAGEGYVITAAKNAHIVKPIHMLHVNTKGEGAHMNHPQLFIKAYTGSDITVIESYNTTSNDAVYFNNVTARVEVDPNAFVHHYKVQLESRSAYQVNNTFITQHRDSIYTNYAVDLGGSLVRNNLAAEHTGPGVVTNYFGAYLANGNQHIDNQTFIDHAVPHCESNELYKGILAGKARGVFNGKVLVRRDAQKTNAFQQNNSLILDATAVMDAKPQLEIYADDVKCSHGATIGQMDDSAVFFLNSRGIPRDKAMTLLQQAFVGQAIDKMKQVPVRNHIYNIIDTKLNTIH